MRRVRSHDKLTPNSSASSSALSGVHKAPFLDLKAQFATIRTEVLTAIERVMESQHFILGREVEQFEAEIAKVCECKHAVGCASGSDALLLALMAIGVRAGDEVITTPFTFGATAGAIARLNARPVFVDIEPDTYNIDPEKVRKAVTSRTKVLMPVHLFGLMAKMDPLLEIAKSHGLSVIEDAAQSVLAADNSRAAGSLGKCGCFSFFPSKNLGGAGDGGMITTNDDAIAQRLKVLRAHGCRRKYHYEMVGINSRLDALQAAILRVKLQHLDEWTRARQNHAVAYRKLISERNLHKHVTVSAEQSERTHVYNQFVVRVEERDRLQAYLATHGIPTEVYYPLPLHLQPAFSYLGYRSGDLPYSEAACEQVLALPVFPEMPPHFQIDVVNYMAHFYERSRSVSAENNVHAARAKGTELPWIRPSA